MIPSNIRVTADDFGKSEKISLAIAECVRAGWVNSISVMPWSDAESPRLLNTLASEFPGLKIGVHLSLIEAPFVHPATRKWSQTEIGSPTNFKAFLVGALLGKVSLAEVRREWQAQIAAVSALIGGPSRLHHFDSHQHLHLLPGLFGVTVLLQRMYSVPVLRIPLEKTIPAWTKEFPLGALLQGLCFLRWHHQTENFFGFSTSLHFRFLKYRKILESAIQAPRHNYEIMVHPGYGFGEEKELEIMAEWFASKLVVNR